MDFQCPEFCVSGPTFRALGPMCEMGPGSWVLIGTNEIGLESWAPPTIPCLGSHFSDIPVLRERNWWKITAHILIDVYLPVTLFRMHVKRRLH